MLKFASIVIATTLLGSATNATAQECQTRPLAFGIDQAGELESTDCRFPGDICGDCRSPVPGEYWTLDVTAGEMILVTVQGTTALLRVLDTMGRRVSPYWGSAEQSFRAEASGTYRVLVLDAGYLRVTFGGYTIRAQRVTIPIARGLSATAFGDRVSLFWGEHLSTTPILEYAIEAGSVSGASDIGVFSLGRPVLTRSDCICFEASFQPLASGMYYVRIRARNALGWGSATNERSFTITNGPQLQAFGYGRSVTLRWSTLPVGIPLYFELLVGWSPSSPPFAIYNVGAPLDIYCGCPTPYVHYVSDVPPGTYYVRVRAMTSAGFTEPSNEVVVTVF